MTDSHICDSDHRYKLFFAFLSTNRGGYGRNKCAACAYELGLEHARLGLPSGDKSVLIGLPESQAGIVRHKDAYEAYLIGYEDGIAIAA